MTTLSKVNMEPTKASGMPLIAKILILVFFLGIGGYYLYTKVIVKVPAQYSVTYTYPTEKILFHSSEVVVAKCKDFKNIGLYLESDITQDEYNTILMAMATIPSTTLVIPNQELTFKSGNMKLMVYKCQISNGVLMGKLKKI